MWAKLYRRSKKLAVLPDHSEPYGNCEQRPFEMISSCLLQSPSSTQSEPHEERLSSQQYHDRLNILVSIGTRMSLFGWWMLAGDKGGWSCFLNTTSWVLPAGFPARNWVLQKPPVPFKKVKLLTNHATPCEESKDKSVCFHQLCRLVVGILD
jgi:hypothetical protein